MALYATGALAACSSGADNVAQPDATAGAQPAAAQASATPATMPQAIASARGEMPTPTGETQGTPDQTPQLADTRGLPVGTWQVTQTRLTSPGGVQAYGDAELAAARTLRLIVTTDAARWQGPAIATALADFSFAHSCASPRLVAGAQNHFALRCADGQFFGPSDEGHYAFTRTGDGTLSVDWYDGITLALKRS